MNSTVQRINSMVALPTNSVKNLVNTSNSKITEANNAIAKAFTITGTSNTASSWNNPFVWFTVFFGISIFIFSFFYGSIFNVIGNLTDQMNLWITGNGGPPEVKQENIPVAPPTPPQDHATTQRSGMEKVVDKLLPPAKEVFTVSKNDYSYYDAAPLCKALGAELATYDQVKEAWQRGADWCNYGWVKGQMAVYPTQKSTYEELQEGPEDQKGVCGKPGVNGGFFDNPELKYGVTCIGKRPSQSQHDANAIAAGSTRPLTASGIEFEKKVMRFKEGSESLGILPFNKEHWGS
jgi:hypothetical protein